MSVSVCIRRLLRLDFWVRAESMWRFMPGPAFTLPVAVILNRFLTDDLVFILGIWVSSGLGACQADRRSRPGMPYRPGRASEGRVFSRGGGRREEGAIRVVA